MGAMRAAQTIEVRRGVDAFVTDREGVTSRHAFSFGRHYDPAHVRHGPLLVHNEITMLPGAGYPTHSHRDAEIVTWVLEGTLAHADSVGNRGTIAPGVAQRMSAGAGVQHAETNDAWRLDPSLAREPVRFVQMWLAPDQLGGAPGYARSDVSGDLATGRLVPVVSGDPAAGAAVGLGTGAATLYAARLGGAGARVVLPEAAYLHLSLVRGEAHLEGAGALAQGDTVRLSATGGQRLSATSAAEVLVWAMSAPG